ncbi:hypothetical protein P4534_02445 [Peribacillus butanolivorans]|uniref:hypothetical protein n=1 Tax=Peribacillus butanolivorans TaxID=421767 RepID=UPI002E235683|nr:hypothetical protein [Peribacillus butanolivorans]
MEFVQWWMGNRSWLTGMKTDGIKPSIFRTDDDTAVVNIDVILKDLEAELDNY